MPMIICPECAKRITNNVEKCPNCECTKDKFVTLMDRKEQDLIMLRLGKYQVRFNGCKFCSNGTPILKSAVHSF